MSLATSSVLTGVPMLVPASGTSNIDDGESNNNDVRDTSARKNETVSMDRQPQAPRRSISPRRLPENDTTIRTTNADIDFFDGDDDSLEEDLDFINRIYGSDDSDDDSDEESRAEDECSEYIMAAPASPRIPAFAMPPPPPPSLPPPLRHIDPHQHDKSPYRLFGKTKHEYDRTRQPQRSALRNPNSKNRNINSIDNSNGKKKAVTRGVSRHNSADGTEDTRRGSGNLHSIRMRGSIYPIHRRQSIGFAETVRVQEVTPTVVLNDGNTRDLWLQADEAMEIKERRRGLLKRYKEREAKKKKEAERMEREREMIERQEKVKNIMSPPKNHFLSPLATTKKQTRWGGILKKPDLPLPGPSGRRWKANIQNDHPSVSGLSVPSRDEDRSSITSISLGAATSSFLSTSSGGSFSGNDSDSFRGLEKYIDRSGRHQKNMVWDAVFIEQDEQLQFGYYDDERIANLYRTVQSQHDGQQKAVGRAWKDRKAADNYLMTPRTMKLMKKPIDISSITCSNLDEDDTGRDEDATNDNISIGNHGKTDNNTNDETKASARGTTTVKISGDIKGRSKYLRRLSV